MLPILFTHWHYCYAFPADVAEIAAFGASRQCFQPKAAGAGKQIAENFIICFIHQQVKDGFLYLVGCGPYCVTFRRFQLSSAIFSRNYSHFTTALQNLFAIYLLWLTDRNNPQNLCFPFTGHAPSVRCTPTGLQFNLYIFAEHLFNPSSEFRMSFFF